LLTYEPKSSNPKKEFTQAAQSTFLQKSLGILVDIPGGDSGRMI
jgi:hypothetical protein